MTNFLFKIFITKLLSYLIVTDVMKPHFRGQIKLILNFTNSNQTLHKHFGVKNSYKLK